MTAWEQIDLMARGGSITMLALWSWLLVRDHWRYVPARLAVAMNGGICCYLIITAGWYDRPSMIGLLFALGAGASPGLFWLFTKAWFSDEQKIGNISVSLVVLEVLNTLVVQLTFPAGGMANQISAVLFRAFMLAFAVAALWEVWRSREGDLIERRRRIRPLLVGVVAAYVILIAIAEVGHLWALDDTADTLKRAVGGGAVFAVFGFCAAMLRMRQADMFGAAEASGAPMKRPISASDDPLATRLLALMGAQMPHRDETLSIAKLAALLGEQEYRLRRTINGQLGHRNFSAFLNGYRLAEVKSALADPSQRDVPIITLALDAGFGSLGPFNRAFREAEGMTPSEYRARNMTDSGIG